MQAEEDKVKAEKERDEVEQHGYDVDVAETKDDLQAEVPTDGANCKDQFWLEPRTGMDPGPKNPNNKFVESGRKS